MSSILIVILHRHHRALRGAATDGDAIDAAGYLVGYGVAADNLRLGRTVVADGVNPLASTRAGWRAVGERAAVAIVEVEVICSDVAEHRRRVASRSADIQVSSSPPGTRSSDGRTSRGRARTW